MRYLRKGGGEPKVIGFAPPRLDFGDKRYFECFTVEKDKLIIDRSGFNWLFIILGGLLSIPYIYTVFTSGKELFIPDSDFFWTIIIALYHLIFLSILYTFLQGFLGYKKVFIFDRAKGTLTYPAISWFCSKTIPFDDACFIFTQSDRTNLSKRYLELMHSIGIVGVAISGYDYPRELFSLLVWYMDKNRPLPPGEKFDTLRQEDYERRCAEGFPKPLYPANIRILDIDGKEAIYKNAKQSIRTNLSHKERKKRNK